MIAIWIAIILAAAGFTLLGWVLFTDGTAKRCACWLAFLERNAERDRRVKRGKDGDE